MQSKASSPPSLHFRLLCLVLLAFLPVVAGLSFDAWQSRRQALQEALAGVSDDVVLAANAQAMHLSAVSEMLAAVAAGQDRSTDHDQAHCAAYLRRLLGGQAGFANAGMLDADGRLVCTAMGGKRGADYSDRDYFREARATQGFSVGELVTGGVSGQRSLVFAYPRRRADGAFDGVIFVSFRDSEFAKLRLAGKREGDSHFAYFDRNGMLIVTDPLGSAGLEPRLDAAMMRRAAQSAGRPVESNVVTADGRHIGALAAIAGRYGPVAYVRSTVAENRELEAWRAGVLRRAGAALLMLLSGLALCGGFMQRWVVRDLLRMVDFTRTAVSRPIGDAPVVAASAEVHAAMRSVVDMAQRLQDQREQLALLHDEAYDANVRLEEKQVRLSAALARLEGLSAQLIDAQEQERKRLARELHDELGQRLTALKLMLHATLPREAPGSAGWKLAESEVSELISQVRAISVSLRPPALDLFPLDVAMRQMVERLFGGSGIACAFEAAGVPAALNETLKITAFRLVQESLTNIVRHAEATQVSVEMNGGEHGSELELIVRDNGRGFDVEAAQAAARAGTSSGLSGMRERVELLGGALQVESRPGQGTRIVACLPIRQVGEHEEEHIAG